MPRLPSFRAALTVATAIVASVLVVVAVACSAMISPNLPPYTCSPDGDNGPNCLGGQVCAPAGNLVYQCMDRCSPLTCNGFCDPTSGWCLPPSDAATGDDGASGDSAIADAADATTDAGIPGSGDADASPPANPDVDAPFLDGALACHGFGCHCASEADCAAGFACVDSTAIGDLWNVLSSGDGGSGSGVCVQPCCTSSDCASWNGDAGTIEGNVCFATGAGGNYCVAPAWLADRSTLGAKAGGAPCDGDAGGCRSGLCASGACADTCCDTKLSNECANGPCRFGVFPGAGFDKHQTANCTSPPVVGPTIGGQNCASGSNADCKSNLCLPIDSFMGQQQFRCFDACRSRDQCQQSGGPRSQTCSYVQPFGNGDIVAACVPIPGQMGGGAGDGGDGAPCRVLSDCAKGYCATPPDGGQGVCLAVCFADVSAGSLSDCPSMTTGTGPAERCRPEPIVVGTMSYSVLACGF